MVMKPSVAILALSLTLLPSCVTRATAGRLAIAGYYAGRIDEAAAGRKTIKDLGDPPQPGLVDLMLEVDRMTYANRFDRLVGASWSSLRPRVMEAINAAKKKDAR